MSVADPLAQPGRQVGAKVEWQEGTDMPTTLALATETQPRPGLQHVLAGMRGGAVSHSAQRGDVLRRARDPSDCVTILETGLCASVRSLSDGQQQTVAIHVPGDVVDHEAFTLGVARSTITALSPVTYYRMPHARLRIAMTDDPKLSAAFCRYVAFHGALAQEWLVSMGRRPAYERTAHLLCEIVYRVHAAGMGEATSCAFPMTQTELADMLGLSVVHINRTLQRLRQEGHIALSRGRLEILDWPEAARLAGFDTSYLETVDGA